MGGAGPLDFSLLFTICKCASLTEELLLGTSQSAVSIDLLGDGTFFSVRSNYPTKACVRTVAKKRSF